jgi:hypothetical protein
MGECGWESVRMMRLEGMEWNGRGWNGVEENGAIIREAEESGDAEESHCGAWSALTSRQEMNADGGGEKEG